MAGVVVRNALAGRARQRDVRTWMRSWFPAAPWPFHGNTFSYGLSHLMWHAADGWRHDTVVNVRADKAKLVVEELDQSPVLGPFWRRLLQARRSGAVEPDKDDLNNLYRFRHEHLHRKSNDVIRQLERNVRSRIGEMLDQLTSTEDVFFVLCGEEDEGAAHDSWTPHPYETSGPPAYAYMSILECILRRAGDALWERSRYCGLHVHASSLRMNGVERLTRQHIQDCWRRAYGAEQVTGRNCVALGTTRVEPYKHRDVSPFYVTADLVAYRARQTLARWDSWPALYRRLADRLPSGALESRHGRSTISAAGDIHGETQLLRATPGAAPQRGRRRPWAMETSLAWTDVPLEGPH